IVYHVYNFNREGNDWVLNLITESSTVKVGRLEIENNESFDMNYILHETYGGGSFNWTNLKSIFVPAGGRRNEYIKINGTNSFAIQTWDRDGMYVSSPNSKIRLVFS